MVAKNFLCRVEPDALSGRRTGSCRLHEKQRGTNCRTVKTHKKLLATAHRSESVYNRADEQSVTFCERGEARKRADDFFA